MAKSDGSQASDGTHTEIFALATLLQSPVYVFCSYAGLFQWTQFAPLFDHQIKAPIPYVTIMHCGLHYDAVKHSTSFCSCSLTSPVLLGSSSRSNASVDEIAIDCTKGDVMAPSSLKVHSIKRIDPSPSRKRKSNDINVSTDDSLHLKKTVQTKVQKLTCSKRATATKISNQNDNVSLPVTAQTTESKSAITSAVQKSANLDHAYFQMGERKKSTNKQISEFQKVINIAPNISCISCTKLFYLFSIFASH